MQLNLQNVVPFNLPIYLYSTEYIVLSIFNPLSFYLNQVTNSINS